MLKFTGRPSEKVVVGPKPGADFASIRVGDGFMLVSADPVTGVADSVGEYAVNANANDIATSGNRPQFMESVILLPPGSEPRDIRRVARQMHVAAKRLGIAIVGGHTEVTPGLDHPVVMAMAFSFVKDYISSGDARTGDSIMMTKTAGLEGTAILAGRARPEVGRRFLSRLSVVDEAEAAFATGKVRAMHDCTEGGILGAAFEMALASGTGFVMDRRLVPVAPETRSTCEKLSIDPLRLIGSGSLLLAVEKGEEGRVSRALGPHCKATKVGEFVKGKRTLVEIGGRETEVEEAPEDELWRVLGRG